MGNAQSYMRSLASKADCILPSHYESGWYEKSNAGSDRKQFIQGVVTRDNDRLVARIVAKKDGVIHAKIEPGNDGKDQKEAFRALKRHVEMELDVILDQVPGANAAASKVAACDASGEAANSQSTGASKAGFFQGWVLASHGGSIGGSIKTELTGSRTGAMPTCSPPAYNKDANEMDVKKHLLGDRGCED
ncbi:hypothetical protein KC340_g10788 [Hortaea werneckii]|nr:hypothetical protein KC342_g11731 [Hortaea werneckii]KAI7090463.1 hypothetical protein KC339_g12636 [Hortaea werneckii]KAI7206975.1 hypothetical protein KC365_g16833 [Hortaea werneckii]KAI7309328.1 hypothetical protein KC340_g10788 [Hortaea werneckii]KAI7381525.1 hypothetical protein KC328_g12177 [Hortaea werneckii]